MAAGTAIEESNQRDNWEGECLVSLTRWKGKVTLSTGSDEKKSQTLSSMLQSKPSQFFRAQATGGLSGGAGLQA